MGNDTPKENMHYPCIACVTIDYVMKMDKKNYPRVYLDEFLQMSRFINTELESDSDSQPESDSETEWKSDTELMAKLESRSDSA